MIRSIRLGSYKREKAKDKKIEPGGKAAIGGIKTGDHVTEINGISTKNLHHTEALTAVKRAQYSLSLVLNRPNEEDGNTIQSVAIAPEANQTRISLRIGPKTPTSSAPSSPKCPRAKTVENVESVPTGQSYMKKLMGSQEDLIEPKEQSTVHSERSFDFDKYSPELLEQISGPPRHLQRGRRNSLESKTTYLEYDDIDLPPLERDRSKTLPKKLSSKNQEINNNNTMYRTKSLPRNTSINGGPSNKAPQWYKQMYKEMHHSMEGESHLSKLLTSDAKRGAFRKYDGASSSPSSPRELGSMSPEERRAIFGANTASVDTSNVPRRLQGGGRSIASHPNRKSLPNIHAANFNFMNTAPVYSKEKTPTLAVDNKEKRKSINSEWYRQLQNGAEIPEVGLATKKQAYVPSKKEPTTKTYVQVNSYLRNTNKKDESIANPSTVNIEYNNPPDFLELRKNELKNKEIEKEREALRQKREQKRLEEEERLNEQKEIDRIRIKKEHLREQQHQSEEEKRRKQEEERKKEEYRLRKEEEQRLYEEQQQKQFELPEFGKAKYSFHPQGPGELDFRKGETIRLLRSIDENWVEGEHKGLVGIFPISYVEFLEPAPLSPNSSLVKPPSQITPTKHTELSTHIETNTHFKPVKKVEETKAYIEPEVIKTQVEEVVQSEPELQFDRVDAPLHIEEGLAKARYTFKAENDNELCFRKGDTLTLLRQIDEHWYEGELDHQIGIFPLSYVQVVREPVVLEAIPKPPPEPEPVVEEVSKVVKQPKVEASIDFEKIFNDPFEAKPLPFEEEDKKPKQKEIQRFSGIQDIDELLGDFEEYNKEQEREEEEKKKMNGYAEPALVNGSVSDDINDLIGQGEPHRAIYSYAHTNEDEVDLRVGDIVHVLEKCDDGWYVGTCERTGAFGTFPGNYVVTVS